MQQSSRRKRTTNAHRVRYATRNLRDASARHDTNDGRLAAIIGGSGAESSVGSLAPAVEITITCVAIGPSQSQPFSSCCSVRDRPVWCKMLTRETFPRAREISCNRTISDLLPSARQCDPPVAISCTEILRSGSTVLGSSGTEISFSPPRPQM